MPVSGNGSYLFVSYAGADRARARVVADAVRTLGVSIWMDGPEIAADGTLDRPKIAADAGDGPELAAEIAGSAAVLLMCSAAALASPTVRHEVQIAWRSGRLILPLLLEPVEIPDEVAYWLEGAQWVEVLDRAPAAAWLPAVARALARVGALDRPSIREPAPGPAPAGPDPLAGVPHNLPLAATAPVGRERALAQVRSGLGAARLVTLTGSGGVGKTCLALAAARGLGPVFPDGVWLVDLAPVSDPGGVPAAIAAVLGVGEAPGQSPADAVAAHLAGRTALLLLDNLEHLLAAGAFVAELLRACPELRVLATSRVPLRVAGEWSVPVPPLAVPDPDDLPPLATLAQNPAVRLFVVRAAVARPGFGLTVANAAAVAAICARLDGLPLAIELAAARVRLLPPAALLARLGDRLDLLTERGGSDGERSPRQRTLRATLAWSYDLLAPPEQAIFRRLGVFTGGATLAAIEGVSRGVEELSKGSAPRFLGSSTPRLLDSVDALLDHGFLVADGGVGETDEEEPRVRQLETIRAYALELLAESGEERAAREGHAAYFAGLARALAPELTGAAQAAALARLDADRANLGATLTWLTGGPDPSTTEIGLRLASDLWRFWWVRGYVREGHEWLDRALAAAEDAAPEIRLTALNAAGILAETRGEAALATARYEAGLALARERGDAGAAAQALDNLGLVAAAAGDFAGAVARYEEALAAYRAAGAERGIATVLHHLSTVSLNQGDLDRAAVQAGESLACWRALADPHGVGFALQQLGVIAQLRGDFARSTALYDEAVALSRSLGDVPGLAAGLLNLGHAAERQGDLILAATRFDEALAAYRELDDQGGIAYTEWSRGDLARARGDLAGATRLLAAALGQLRRAGEQETIALCLESLAAVAVGQHDPAQAATLLGAADAHRAAVGVPVPPTRQAEYAATLAAVRASLPPADLGAAWGIGRVMSLDQLLAEVGGA